MSVAVVLRTAAGTTSVEGRILRGPELRRSWRKQPPSAPSADRAVITLVNSQCESRALRRLRFIVFALNHEESLGILYHLF